MGRQIPPSHLKVPTGPSAVPQRFLTPETAVVNHYTNTEKIIPTIPGFRTSAAFLTSLSANLRIDPDLPSPLGTPNNLRTGSAHPYLPPPSPLSFSTISTHHNPYPSPAATDIMSPLSLSSSPIPPKSPVDILPTLSTYTAESEDERTKALRLVADSVAQQRQQASRILLLHPLNLAAYMLVLATMTQFMWRTKDDLLILLTAIGGVTMTCFAAVRFAVGGYVSLAEEIGWEWLGEDRLIVVKWGEDIIGALVLGWADEGNGAFKKPRGGRRRRGKAVVRAWTVKLKYRGNGVGEGLLEEAVKVAGERGADGIVFDGEHANSQRVLPNIYNGFLDKQEERAEKALAKVADEKGNFRQRRMSPTWGSR